MKILFICGSLEPGKDGVGDYTRKLSIELCKLGSQVNIVAVRDKYTQVLQKRDLSESGLFSPITEIRIPAIISSNERKKVMSSLLENFSPDWLSIQYVGYSFDKRGIPLSFIKELKLLRIRAKIHIMFHEIWQGESDESKLKDKLVGFFQKQSAKILVFILRIKVISTSNVYYQQCLKKAGIIAGKIPIFSNIPMGNINSNEVVYNQLPIMLLNNPQKFILGCFFGGFHPHIELTDQLIGLAADIKLKLNKQLFIVHIGNNLGTEDKFSSLRETTGINVAILGQHTDIDIADFMLKCDVGLSNHPKVLYEKSGSNSALLYNKCPILILRKSFEIDNRKISEIEEYRSINDIESFINQDKSFYVKYGVDATVRNYIEIFN